MLDYNDFLSFPHCLLIAPAGYGKTHTISQCLKKTIGRQLILTHTHAGVAAIKDKMRKEQIPNNSFSIETISSFAQKYVLAFLIKKEEVPCQENTKEYFPFIMSQFFGLLKLKPIQEIIKNTYAGIFVDEYQDCTIDQHNIITKLSELFPCRIFGDHMQGIFGFNGIEMVDLNDQEMMGEFYKKRFTLDTPWRWKNSGNVELGEDLKKIRKKLELCEVIDLAIYRAIDVIETKDIYDKKNYKEIQEIFKMEKSVLVLTPDTFNINTRIKFVQQFSNICTIIEAIDSKDFYSISKDIDRIISGFNYVLFKDILVKIFTKSSVELWFNSKCVKNKKEEGDKIRAQNIANKLESFAIKTSQSSFAKLLIDIKTLPSIKCYRKDLYDSIHSVLIATEDSKKTVYEGMIEKRNSIRRQGRKVDGKYIGTTLLTKGLEFDTVIVINAHKFNCPKHLYVALTRASKKLVIFTESIVLSPYK